MVKPPLRTKSIGFKVSEEEYAQLETAAQASGRTLGEWCREVVLAGCPRQCGCPSHSCTLRMTGRLTAAKLSTGRRLIPSADS